MCKGVAVMRRRSDGWLNATQILKVAGFDKPQRTRVLERDIQKGEHEKVQGGYGKYQGKWPWHDGLVVSHVGAVSCVASDSMQVANQVRFATVIGPSSRD